MLIFDGFDRASQDVSLTGTTDNALKSMWTNEWTEYE